MADYQYIDRQHQLDLAVTYLSDSPVVGVDTESSGYYTYFSELCLIQISAGNQHYIIDPLAQLSLSGLGEVFANPNIVKIFHSAASDIGELHRDLGFTFTNVFDTMIACRMLGHESCSLQSLVKQYMNIELEKKEQKSNWKRRPLTRSQLDYAHLDTLYLAELREKLIAQLEEFGLMEEAREEFDWIAARSALKSANEAEDQAPPEDAWTRVRGGLELSPEDRGILKELYAVRDQRARKENLAAFRLLTNDGLMQLLRARPRSLDDLGRLRALNPRMVKKDGPRILAAFENPTPIADEDLPRPPELQPHIRQVLRRLKRWRARIAEYRGFDTGMIISNRSLIEIADRKPENLEALGELELMTGWKLKNYGEHILKVVDGSHTGALPEGLPRLPEEVREQKQERHKAAGKSRRS